MKAETIISIVSLCITLIIGVLTLIANVRINKISHIKDLHEYQRDITYFELMNRDEKWLCNLIQKGEFIKYSKEAQEKIIAWYLEYSKTHPPILIHTDMDVEAIERTRRSKDIRLQMLLKAPGPDISEDTVKMIMDKINKFEHINVDDICIQENDNNSTNS